MARLVGDLDIFKYKVFEIIGLWWTLYFTAIQELNMSGKNSVWWRCFVRK